MFISKYNYKRRANKSKLTRLKIYGIITYKDTARTLSQTINQNPISL